MKARRVGGDLDAPRGKIIAIDLDEVGVRRLRIDDNEVSKGDDITENLVEELSFLTDNGEDMSTTWDVRDLEFALEDLGEMDIEALTDEIAEEVNQLSKDTQEKIDEESGAEVPITKILGFSKVNKEQERWIRAMKAHIESETDLEGPQAFSEYAQEFMGLETILSDD